tara:strand:- start:3281 stop:3562 length:282 start_codon:yes stop_codon:yes gene_type:complete
MDNGNNPAHPLTGEAYTNFASYDESNQLTSYDPQCQGLTKREAFAMAAMQGMITSRYAGEYMNEINDKSFDKPSGLANNAVRYADALLKELEK